MAGALPEHGKGFEAGDAGRPAEAARREGGPWGALPTVFFTVTIAGSFVLTQSMVSVPFLVAGLVGKSKPDLEAITSELETNGLLLGVSEVIAGTVALGFTVLLAWVRKGPTVGEYLALKPAPRRTTLVWLLWAVLLGPALDGMAYVAGYDAVPPWMFDIYRTAGFLPLLVLAVVVMAPVLEELVFRGFFFEGMRHSPLGANGTVLLASFLWASTHIQYDWFYVGQIFIFGCLLGSARARTESVVPAILMHALFNGVSMMQVALEAGR